MKEKPTTFQLAQLAAQASAHIARPKDAVRRAWDLWSEAEAEIAEHDRRADYLRSLFQSRTGKDVPIFTDSPEMWCERLKAYPGDQRDVERELWNREFSIEDVEKRLFRDKSLGRATRRKFFVGLARVCIRFDMEGPLVAHKGRLEYLEGGEFIAPEPGFPIHPKNLQRARDNHRGEIEMLIPAREVRFVKEVEAMLSQPRLYAHLVRWAVEVRQRQLAESKTRVIPESLRRRRQQDDWDEGIQFKRTIRQ